MRAILGVKVEVVKDVTSESLLKLAINKVKRGSIYTGGVFKEQKHDVKACNFEGTGRRGKASEDNITDRHNHHLILILGSA